MRRAMALALFAIFVLGVMIPIRTNEGKSHFFPAIKEFFHYSSGDSKPVVKETPTKFEETMKKQIKYPETKAETK
ncbi:MAG: hypothetical protein PHI59_02420 [Candidatus Omnitrophica bacterium]|nr:hypothetical protein [Candidatus Omnitrophota bacterium]